MTHKYVLQVGPEGDREIVMKRSFDASRDLVFEAMTRPDLLKRWLFGPVGWTMTHCAVDLRVGGKYRFEWRKVDGTEMGMGGIYREIVRPAKLVTTELFDQDWTGGEVAATALFDEKAGVTTLTTTLVYPTKAAREAVLTSGMERGVAVGYDRLDDIFAESTEITT
ncbi:MAG TPA: SRPBCC family protein [Rhodanobacteraceae bacterium]|nr:SRPBCC family protein [Rhodanobacteraceae bacterium]